MRVGSPLSPQPCRGSQLAEEPQGEVVGRAVHGGQANMHRSGFPVLGILLPCC